jgi:hypothetical protein
VKATGYNPVMRDEVMATCPDCGASLALSETCETNFFQMLYWENEFPEYGEQVHHLIVLCYHVQHPGLYSKDGLAFGLALLDEFVNRGATPQRMGKHIRSSMVQRGRKLRVGGTAENHGEYPTPITWSFTTADVIREGHQAYCLNVQRWAEAILADLEGQGVGIVPGDILAWK